MAIKIKQTKAGEQTKQRKSHDKMIKAATYWPMYEMWAADCVHSGVLPLFSCIDMTFKFYIIISFNLESSLKIRLSVHHNAQSSLQACTSEPGCGVDLFMKLAVETAAPKGTFQYND